ncbi:MAG: methylated-DNA--[protein]-cysteine S-methyltransferase [Microbacteriaceae bacterium]
MKIPNFDSATAIESPIGNINIFAEGEAVVFLDIGQAPVAPLGKSKVLSEAAKQLDRYFRGKSKQLDFKVKLEGTKFQQAVWSQIAELGFGEISTYAEIAMAIGNPKAVRAVGGAVGANPVPLVVGCHRVLGASGKITGYSGGAGIPTKQWLLTHESIAYVD